MAEESIDMLLERISNVSFSDGFVVYHINEPIKTKPVNTHIHTLSDQLFDVRQKLTDQEYKQMLETLKNIQISIE